ncbi:hypothetical protein G6F65_021165 [Rhizopus arrhizus]|nr:hypothetical protein G6F65_021165 [Rhizopus arrhizus]
MSPTTPPVRAGWPDASKPAPLPLRRLARAGRRTAGAGAGRHQDGDLRCPASLQRQGTRACDRAARRGAGRQGPARLRHRDHQRADPAL